MMLSFVVISLFTRIPVDLALRVARQRLESDNTLSDQTHLDIDEIMSLLSLCLNATYFSFQDPWHSNGVSCVGSHSQPGDGERALETFSTPVKCWK